MNVMLLAAGQGTRLRPYTHEIPKPAIPFLTAPLASYSLQLFELVNINKLVVNTHHLSQQIEYLFKDLKPKCKKLIFSDEKDLLLGSGGGIHKAYSHLSGEGSFLVANADEVILPENPYVMEDFIKFHNQHKGLATLMVMPHPEVGTKFGGVWTDEKNKVVMFSKTNPGQNLIGHHYLGVLILKDEIKKYFKNQIQDENILYETLTQAIQQGEEVFTYPIEAQWFETGNPQDLLTATDTCLSALSEQKHMWAQYLTQLIRIWGLGQTLIEKEKPALLEKMHSTFKNLQIRLD